MSSYSRIVTLFMAIGTATAPQSYAQPGPPHTGFEVASVKPAADPGGRALLQAVPGRLTITNISLRRLILIAWGIQDYQLSGDMPWLDSDHYDIQAKADGSATVQQMEGPMLQALLQDRFKLMVHRETRQLPVYRLVQAKDGSKLQQSKAGSCTPYALDSQPPAAPSTGQPRPNYCGAGIAVDGLNRILDGKGVSMSVLAASLSRTYNSALGRNVIDGTGLTGTFDFRLKWSMDPPPVPPTPGAAAAPEPANPSLFTAIQEQLGLKLESAKGPVAVLVIDRIEKPSAN